MDDLEGRQADLGAGPDEPMPEDAAPEMRRRDGQAYVVVVVLAHDPIAGVPLDHGVPAGVGFKLLPFLLSNDPNTYYDYSNIEATLYDQQIKKIYQNLYKLNSLPNTIEYTYFKNIPIIMGLNKFKKILEIAYTAAIAAKNNDDAFAFISTTSPAGGAGSGINAAALPTKNNASITAFFSTPDLFSNTNADDAPLKSNTLKT